MESNYDEDLSENVFFQVFQTEYFNLFSKATAEGWIICVPRADSIPKYSLETNDFFSHVLIPNEELPETHFRTLNGKEVRICNRVVLVDCEDAVSFTTQVLFEETYYTADMLRYKVLCVESPLQHYSNIIKMEGIISVHNLRDCINFLLTESNKDVLERIDESVHMFLSLNNMLELKSIQEQKESVSELYTKCLNIALKSQKLREKTYLYKHMFDNVKVSVESYIHHSIYSKLIKSISACTANDDACFNKIVRNLNDIQLKDLRIGSEFQVVIPKARSELKKIECYNTIIGKVGCLRKTIIAISNEEVMSNQTNVLAADELLPMLVFLVIKSGIPNWIAHLTFMKEFSFSNSTFHGNQHNFLLTSLEAAITYIKIDVKVGLSEHESQIIHNDLETNEMQKCEQDSSCLSTLFNFVKKGNSDKVQEILSKKEMGIGSLEGLNLCHPLCSCDKCEKELSISMYKLPTIHSCDDRGLTVLHVASMCGQPKLVDVLIRLGANLNKTDYKGATALHYAGSKGHQNSLLILLHAGAVFDHSDNEGNTVLHLAAANGHESCIKALLYFIEQNCKKVNIDCLNNQGETPLHNASRWGFTNITAILLEYGASPLKENKRKQTPIDVANNTHILNQLVSSKIQPIENLSLIESDVTTLSSLDFTDDESPSTKTSAVTPKSTDDIKKIERVLRAIRFGDITLACFYLGLDVNSKRGLNNNCHPLCNCNCNQNFGTLNTKNILDINSCNAEGITPLHEAAKSGQTELIKLLIDASADVNVQAFKSGKTPFHLACQNQKFNVAKLLLETGKLVIDIKDSIGNTGLHYASETNNLKLIELILENNAKYDIKNNAGKTPLEIAQESMLISAVQLFTIHTKN